MSGPTGSQFTDENIRKLEAKESKTGSGDNSSTSDSAALKVTHPSSQTFSRHMLVRLAHTDLSFISFLLHLPSSCSQPFVCFLLILFLPQSTLASQSESKQQTIDRVQGNLPLPDQPPTASDFNSADARSVNVGSGGVSSDVSTGAYGGSESGLREPATAASSVRTDGDELKTNTKP